MAKAVNIFISIALLVLADRAIKYWQSVHHDKSVARSIQALMLQNMQQLSPRPHVLPTNMPSQPPPEVIQL